MIKKCLVHHCVTVLDISGETCRRVADMYKEFKLPFWIQIRAEAITRELGEHPKEMNCLRIVERLDEKVIKCFAEMTRVYRDNLLNSRRRLVTTKSTFNYPRQTLK